MPEYQFNQHAFNFSYPAVMGILNLTPDSFSDGGKFINPEIAVAHALKMNEWGAQIIDLGAESTRPGSESISEQEELSRILPVLEILPKDSFAISIDTTKPFVAEACLQAGAHILNDVSGGTPKMIDLASKFGSGLVLMHSQGSPKTMQINPSYHNVVKEVLEFFEAKKESLSQINLPRIWIDPGIGFGKTLEHNLDLMRNIKKFKNEIWGILFGSSRKSWIHQLCNAPSPMDRLGGSLASAVLAIQQGTEIIRTHDVMETKQALDVAIELAIDCESN